MADLFSVLAHRQICASSSLPMRWLFCSKRSKWHSLSPQGRARDGLSVTDVIGIFLFVLPSIVNGFDCRPFFSRPNIGLPVHNDNTDCGEVDVAIVGGGLGGLCAGAILNTIYGKKVGVYEAHYLAGGCAHAFDRRIDGNTYTFDSGPTILLGCSSPPFNALEQVLQAIGQPVPWIRYDGWGMIENPGQTNESRWKVKIGPKSFENGPLLHYGGPEAVDEFRELQHITQPLVAGAKIPALAMRAGPTAIFPLMRYLPALATILCQGDATTGTFAAFMDGPAFIVRNKWLRAWLDALAFSLSGLPAARTAAAAMAFVLNDMHREGATLDYPQGGMGAIVDALVNGVEQGNHGSRVHLRSAVVSLNAAPNGTTLRGLTLENGQTVVANLGVIFNAPVWTLRKLIQDETLLNLLDNGESIKLTTATPTTWSVTTEGSSLALKPQLVNADQSLVRRCDQAEMTGSFLHLHVVLNATGLDVSDLEAHYTVLDRGLLGDSGIIINGVPDGPCGELNMIAVSNPSRIDPGGLGPPGTLVMHAYGAANEPYEVWRDKSRKSKSYQALKTQRAEVLWRAVESIVPDARDRVILSEIGTPLTHEYFLRRPAGTYGAATEHYLPNGSTNVRNLLLAGDGVFPGIGVPSVAISGASAANSIVGLMRHLSVVAKL